MRHDPKNCKYDGTPIESIVKSACDNSYTRGYDNGYSVGYSQAIRDFGKCLEIGLNEVTKNNKSCLDCENHFFSDGYLECYKHNRINNSEICENFELMKGRIVNE